MIKCPSCGGGLRFSPEDQMLICDYCDSRFSVEELKNKKLITAEEYKEIIGDDSGFAADEKTFDATVFTCPQCGGQLLSTDETAATFCSFCGSSVMLKSRMTKEFAPDYVIPFSKSKEDCAAAYRKYLSGALYAPSKMKKEEQISKFRGIYMPYWVYSMDYEGQIAVPGKRTHRMGDYVITDHYSVTADIKCVYDGIAYDASSSFSDNLSNAIAPFDIKEAKDFNAAYLSGYYADVYDVSKETYAQEAKSVIKQDMAWKMFKNPVYEKHGAKRAAIEASIHPKNTETKLGFFPVWFLSCRNKKGDRISYAVVNGQTGETAADLPVSFGKYLTGSLITAVPIFLLLTLFLTLTPRAALITAAVLGVIAFVLAMAQSGKVAKKEANLDDAGYMAVHKPDPNVKAPKKKGLWKPMIGFLICVAFAVINPVNDIYSYIAAIVAMALICWCFRDIISAHNILTTRKLPQLGARGGDENA